MKRPAIRLALAMAVCLLTAGTAGAQAIKNIRINEFLVKNVNSYEDDYGHRVGWIELFNDGYTGVNVGGAYFKVRGKEYRIPKNDPNTVIPPQGYLIFFAEGTSSKGTFHTNFTLDETDYIAFYDQSGRGAAVDSVAFNVNDMLEDVSYGFVMKDEEGKSIYGNLPATTPRATNDTIEKTPRSEIFRREDPSGGVMAMTAMGVVFSALLILCLIFKSTGGLFIWLAKRSTRKNEQRAAAMASGPAAVEKKVKTNIPQEEMAAIAFALYKYSENLHDIENTVLTINRVARAYSPWSSKIYGLRENPNKK